MPFTNMSKGIYVIFVLQIGSSLVSVEKHFNTPFKNYFLSMKRILLFLISLLTTFGLNAQQLPKLSENAYISVLTCGAGDQLYTAFGHTAFRVQDSVLGLDVVYNYGTFDFNKPNFYLNFTKGKLIYSLSRKTFDRFLFEYEYEKRWIKEQILDLSTDEVNALFQFLEDNYRPENRDYAYDPLFNNCSNITGIILKEQLKDPIVFKDDHLKKRYTFRELVRQYIPINSWGSFGIELAFGGVTDRVATVEEHMFLPYYAMEQLRNSLKGNEPLVQRERVVLDYPEMKPRGTFMTSPLFWFLLILCLVLVISYLDWKHGTRHRWLDFTLFLFSGLIGTFIILLWLATDHIVTGLNFNFLWLLPSNIIVAFILLRKGTDIPWLKKYIWLALGGIGMSLLLWAFGIHVQSPLNIPLLLILTTRYALLLKRA